MNFKVGVFLKPCAIVINASCCCYNKYIYNISIYIYDLFVVVFVVVFAFSPKAAELLEAICFSSATKGVTSALTARS